MSSSDKKIKRLASFIQKNPGDSFSKFALALEFLKNDEFNKARILFEDIHRNDPDYVGVYYHLGKLYEMMNEQSKARELYKQGIDIASQQEDRERTTSELVEALAELEIEMEQND